MTAHPTLIQDMDSIDPIFALHAGGKLTVRSAVPLRDADDLSMAYTPGVARVCEAIAARPELVFDYTWKANTVAIVTDGSAVLGLGDIGPAASMPVMEGKAILFKQFANVDAVPIALDCHDLDELVETIIRIAPGFGGINLEDISAPRCFELERRLQERLDIPVFHDDQHGTAVVVLAALWNAATLLGRDLADLRVVVSGAGAAGVAVTNILLGAGVVDVTVADRQGVLYAGRAGLTETKSLLAQITNPSGSRGSLESALRGADVYIGVSGGQVSEAAVASMARERIIFSLANPTPEIDPGVAGRLATIYATGRSDLPNQINNVLAFPGIFRGALDARAVRVTEGMKIAAARAIADIVGADLGHQHIVPSPFDERVAIAVAQAVAVAASQDGVIRTTAR